SSSGSRCPSTDTTRRTRTSTGARRRGEWPHSRTTSAASAKWEKRPRGADSGSAVQLPKPIRRRKNPRRSGSCFTRSCSSSPRSKKTPSQEGHFSISIPEIFSAPEAHQTAEDPPALRFLLHEELLQLPAVEEDSFAGRTLLDLDPRDRLDVHVAATLGALAPVELSPLLRLGAPAGALRLLAPLARRLDHLFFVLAEPVVLAPAPDVFAVPCHARILAGAGSTASGCRRLSATSDPLPE